MDKITQQWLAEQYDDLLITFYNESKRAPMRGKYNKLTGSYAPTKNDIMKACTANIGALNMLAESRGLRAVHDFEEEQTTIPGKAK